MATKYLNDVGLRYFYERLKVIFAGKQEFTDLYNQVQSIVSEGGEPNRIDYIKVNGTRLVPDASKEVSLTVPTSTSDLTNDGDGTSNFATEDYVAQNGGKIDTISVNGTAQTITNKNVNLRPVVADVAIPTSVQQNYASVLFQRLSPSTAQALTTTTDYLAQEVEGKIDSTKIGAANGVAGLDASGKIDTSQLPSYIDDVVEVYPVGTTELASNWLALTAGGAPITPESGKIYVLMADSTNYTANSQFRFGGTTYVKLSDGGVSSITTAEIDTIIAGE